MKFIKKFFSVLFEDFQWKLLALAAASVIWFIGTNMSDPYQNLIVSPRLLLENIEIMQHENIAVLNEDALRDINVPVHVRGLRSDMDKLRAAMADPVLLSDLIEVRVDFRAIDSEAVAAADGVSTQRLSISVDFLQPGYEHLSINPRHVEVMLDTYDYRLLNIQIIQQGEVPPGFELQYVNLRNEFVNIRGPRSDLRTVSIAQAVVDITNVYEDAEMPVRIRVIDESGDDMTARVRPNVEETTAYIRVWQVRQADIRMRPTGQPASGYALAEITGEMSSVEIVGPEELLDETESIRIEFDITGAYSNITRTVDISEWLPEGISLRSGEEAEMSATARIEPIEERTLTIPRGNIRSRGVVGHYSLVNENAQLRVTVSGPRSVISALTATDIELEFDLRALPIGIHTVPLMVYLPPGISLVGSPPTLVVQINEPASAAGDDGGHDDLTPIPSPDPTIPPDDGPPQDPPPDDDELPQGALDDETVLEN